MRSKSGRGEGGGAEKVMLNLTKFMWRQHVAALQTRIVWCGVISCGTCEYDDVVHVLLGGVHA